jgi:hypothetical protein
VGNNFSKGSQLSKPDGNENKMGTAPSLLPSRGKVDVNDFFKYYFIFSLKSENRSAPFFGG